MTSTTAVTFDCFSPVLEAKRLGDLGCLKIEWRNELRRRPHSAVGRVMGHAVDGEQRDVFLFQEVLPDQLGTQLRAIVVYQVVRIYTATEDEAVRD